MLYLDGRSVVNEPLIRRREWLKDAIKKDTPYRVSEFVEDGESLFAAQRNTDLREWQRIRTANIFPERRNDSWYKIKVRQTAESYIIGYTEGKGSRGEHFGALHTGDMVGGKLVYRGKVGSGFDDKIIKDVYGELKKLKETKKPVSDKILDAKQTIWVEPKIIAEIEYSSMTRDGYYREGVFLRLRPDL